MKTMLRKTVLLLMIVLLFAPACTLPITAEPTQAITPSPTKFGDPTITPTNTMPWDPTFTPSPTKPGDPTLTPSPTKPGDPTLTPSPTQPGDPTFTPSPTQPGDPSFTPSMTLLAEPNVTALKNTNCRYGPGTAYDIADTLFAGKSAPLVGRNEQNTWWQIKGPTFGSLCWVSKVTVEVHGPADGIPIGAAPPVPTLTPKPRPRPQSQGCYVYDALGKPVCTAPCPANAKPGGVCRP
ncbi:MAG: hypothetical protein ACM33V_03440 [Chloroflexota bacterium]